METLRRLAKWYFSRKALPYWSVLALDSMFVLIAGILIYFIHHGAAQTLPVLDTLLWTVLATLACYIIGFRIFHTYSGVIRFSSFSDLMRITSAVVIALALTFVFQWVMAPHKLFLKLTDADIVFMGILVIIFMWFTRIIVKNFYEMTLHNAGERAFIVGVREGGIALAKNINSSADMPYHVRGFVSDDPQMFRRHLMGLRVYPFDKDLVSTMTTRGITTLIISPLMMQSLRDNEALVDALVTAGIKLLVVPQAREWDGKSDLLASELRPVDVEDLLPREKIEVDMQAASHLINDNTVLITGAAGSIGSEIVRQVAEYQPAQLILVDQAETPMHDIRLMLHDEYPAIQAQTIVADIADPVHMEQIFRQYNPQYVFHAAAYKHVPMMEDNPYQAIINNVYGTKVIADLSVKYNTRKFVMVSTDKAVNPTNVMGCSKRLCEIYVQSLDQAIKERTVEGQTQFVTTRFGNVLGSNGSVIPIFQKQIRQGGPITVTHPDIIRFFMLIPEACRLVIEAGTMGRGGEIYVFDMGKPVKIADLARRMILLSGAKNIEIEFTGLRDGEKLYEEVLNNQEITLPTFHPKIKIAKVREYAYADVNKQISYLIDIARNADDMTIVAHMKAIVPEYKSQHSKYQSLDK